MDIYAMILNIALLTLGLVQVIMGVLVNLGWLKVGGIWVRSPLGSIVQGAGWICVGLHYIIFEARGMKSGMFRLEMIGFCLVIVGVMLDRRQ